MANGDCSACCINKIKYGNIKNERMDDIWNNKVITSVRKRMINGELIPECKVCYEKEQNNIFSWRKWNNERYAEYIDPLIQKTDKDGILNNKDLIYIDLRYDNICNCKCRMCGHYSSNLWYEDCVKLGYRTEGNTAILSNFHNSADLIKKFDPYFDNLKKVLFGGGEPMLSPINRGFLEYLVGKGLTDVNLVYTTNLGYFPDDLVQLLSKFSNVEICVSIDGLEDQHNYIRGNSNLWKKMLNNFHRIPHFFNKLIIPCMSVYNAYHLPDLLEFALDNLKISPDKIALGITTDRTFLNPAILPEEFKQKCIVRYKKIIERYGQTVHFNTCINVLEQCVENSNMLMKEFFEYTDLLDNIRNVRLKDVFPELNNLRIS